MIRGCWTLTDLGIPETWTPMPERPGLEYLLDMRYCDPDGPVVGNIAVRHIQCKKEYTMYIADWEVEQLLPKDTFAELDWVVERLIRTCDCVNENV